MKKFFIILTFTGLAVFSAACNEGSGAGRGKVQQDQQKIVQTYIQRLIAAVPYPENAMRNSLERRNIRERLLRFNDASKIGYLYELTDFGQVVAYFTIKGKPTAIASQMTPSDQTTCIDIKNRDDPCFVVASPMDDGSWGPSEPGIFFFTTEGVMLEWNGLFQYSDYPLDIDPTTLTIRYDADNAKPSSTASEVKPQPTPSGE